MFLILTYTPQYFNFPSVNFFSYFATPWKWCCLTLWNVKKSGLFRRLFQYSVICHSSKYIRLALGYFIGFVCGYNWAKLKKNHRRKREKTDIFFGTRVVIHLSTRLYHAMYRVREGKSKSEPFYRLFRELFAIFFCPQAWSHVWTVFETIATYTEVILRLSIAEVVFVSS